MIPIICKAEVVFQSARVSFIKSTIYDINKEVLAMGQGTYRLIKTADLF